MSFSTEEPCEEDFVLFFIQMRLSILDYLPDSQRKIFISLKESDQFSIEILTLSLEK